MASDPLLQPYTIGALTLRNRIMTTSHEPAYPEDGMPKDRYRAYHAERARAGVALTMTAGSAAVSRTSPPVFNNVLAYKDEVVGWMRKLADECHGHGCAVMIQLTHLGRRTTWNKGDWLPTVAPGPYREPAHRAFPKVLEDFEIDRIITDYADAAERMRAAGLDGVEFQCYGHLPDQFMSPLTNTLDAPWGGGLENRSRFALEVLKACRARVGPDFMLGMRYTADETEAGGIAEDEGIAIGKMFRDTGADFLNVIRGRIHTDAALTDVIPVQGMKSAPHLDFAGRIKAEVGLPTFHAARIPDVATARHAVASGQLDMVGMTRAHMADPHVVKKIAAGREDDIRPCVGATYCLDRIYQAGDALCIHNPSTGRELSQPHDIAPAERAQRIVVVGAGPAGLEAARVAAERGHAVTVLEAAPDPGGQIRLTAQNHRRREMIGIIDWRMAQCAARDVGFRFNTVAETDDVVGLDPDVVIVATGGLPTTEILETGNDLVVSTWDIISGDVKPGSTVLLYDDAGDHAALQAAETLAGAGARVEIMTPRPHLRARRDGHEPRPLHAQPAAQGRDIHRHVAPDGRRTGRQHDPRRHRHRLFRPARGAPLRPDRGEPRHDPRWTSSTSRSSRCRGTGAPSTRTPLSRTGPNRRGRQRVISRSFASATRCRPATPMPRSTMRSGWSARSESSVMTGRAGAGPAGGSDRGVARVEDLGAVIPVTRREPRRFSRCRRDAAERLDIEWHLPDSLVHRLGHHHRDIPDLGVIDGVGPDPGHLGIEIEPLEHRGQGVDPLLIDLFEIGLEHRVRQRPGPDREIERRVEQTRIEPAIEKVVHRLGDALGIGLGAGDQVAGVLLFPAVDQRGQQPLPAVEMP